jgi:hypothetical protein
MGFPYIQQPCDSVCCACGLKVPIGKTSPWTTADLEATQLLRPMLTHHGQQLIRGMLLNVTTSQPITDSSPLDVCASCASTITKNRTPRLALANGLWVGEIPTPLMQLTTAETFLISRTTAAKSVFDLSTETVSLHISLCPDDGCIHMPFDDDILPR